MQEVARSLPSDADAIGVYLSGDYDLRTLYGRHLDAVEPGISVRMPEDIAACSSVQFAVCWNPPQGSLSRYPNLKFAFVPGAGVDALLNHPELSQKVAVCRVRDPDQAQQMAAYVVHEILHVERGFSQFESDAQSRLWKPVIFRPPSEVRVAVLGHGVMGKAIVRTLDTLGFSISTASNSAPSTQLPGVQYNVGQSAVATAVEGADFVVNVLPLTEATRGILNATLFARMASQSWLVQIGRGEHLVETDLLEALNSGRLAGASLDVFATEPLPRHHAFWSDPRLRLTPHVASAPSPDHIAHQIAQSVAELREGRSLSLAVSRDRGY